MTIAAMATIPERLHLLGKVISSLRSQVDVIRVYLNNFEKIPTFIASEEALLSREALGDIGDGGKFFWFDKGEYDYYLTVDDDLLYPENYAATLICEFEKRRRRAVVGVHGFVFSEPIKSYVASRSEKYKHTQALDTARPVHVIGTGTAILNPKTIRLSLKDFPKRNMADLQLAIAAQKQRVPMIVIARDENWLPELQDAAPENGNSIWKETKKDNGRTLAHLANSAVTKWRIFPDPIKDL